MFADQELVELPTPGLVGVTGPTSVASSSVVPCAAIVKWPRSTLLSLFVNVEPSAPTSIENAGRTSR